MYRIAAFAPVTFLLLAVACLGVMPAGELAPAGDGEFGFRRPVNGLDLKLKQAMALAEQIYRTPGCKARFIDLPDFPPGKPLTEWVTAWPDGSKTRIASTVWSKSSPPRIYVLAYYIRNLSVERLALVLIHEQAHVASVLSQVPFSGDVPKEEVLKAQGKNEALAQGVMARCADAAGIALR